MLKFESDNGDGSNRRVLAWVFTAFAVIPFLLWAFDHVTRVESGVLGEWPMLVVTVFFTSMSLIVSNPSTSKRLAGGMVGGIVGVFRSKGGISAEPETDDEEDLPS